MFYPVRHNQNLQNSSTIPLISLSFTVGIENSLCVLKMTQEFLNKDQNPIECEYHYPISKESVVTNLNILLPDGTILKSFIEEQEKALETYQDAISEGNTGVLSKEDSDTMVILVGNLPSLPTNF